MIVRNFFILCIVVGVFAVLFSNLVIYQQKHHDISRFDEPFWLR
ncbi:hypothetical protein [Aurantimonas sp. 22II-16-19i]|nr:hypothetical protein [Aurantimonas sp. 22II-16-19i]